MKKSIVITLILIIFAAFYYLGGVSAVKKLFGYNASVSNKLKITSSPERNGPSFLNIPEGFEISAVVQGLDKPRVITFDSNGRMLVSETQAGRISIFEDKDDDGNFEGKSVLIENLKLPHGLDFYTDKGITYLYIAETHQVARYPYDANAGKLTAAVGEQITKLPAEGRHFTRTIAFGPNFRKEPIVRGRSVDTLGATKLYISVGSSCDVCVESETWKRAAILESDPAGNYTAEFAGGLRNSVFFAFHPKTKEIWATDMGRDDLGENLPPDEINIIKVAGPDDKFGAKRYGWPFCYGKKVRDKTFNPEKIERIDISPDCGKTESPVIEIQAHSAPLGLAFIPSGNGWPKEWSGDLLVALHGSSNSRAQAGYKVVRYDLDANGRVLSQNPIDFISGWLKWLKGTKTIFGRPVDLKFDSNGALYISDDAAGVIYKVKPKL